LPFKAHTSALKPVMAIAKNRRKAQALVVIFERQKTKKLKI